MGGKKFHTREIPQSGSKAKEGEREKREKDRTMVIKMAKLRMAHSSTHGARKPLGPILIVSTSEAEKSRKTNSSIY